MNKADWVWMAHAGHLIVGQDCRFHLTTYVGDFIVSTVGEYWPDSQVRRIHAGVHDPEWYNHNLNRRGDDFDRAYAHRFGYEPIGAGPDSLYETMVFEAARDENDCCPWVMASPRNLDGDRYGDAESAARGHMRLCEEWATKTKEDLPNDRD